MSKLIDILEGTLLGDGCIKFDNYKYRKYLSYKLTAKDKNFLLWFKELINEYHLKCWNTIDNKKQNINAFYFYINNCLYPEIISLRNKWYKEIKGKYKKIVPRDIELTSTVLLHWYLGDGSLNRHRNDNRVPAIVLATNCFSNEDIDFLIQKLAELNLNFYPIKYKSGFTGNDCGFALWSKTQDGTPFRFFKMIGECPKEIENCITGSKGRGSKIHYFKDKWPTDNEWIKILSNVKGIGAILRKRREELKISRKELTQRLSVNPDYIRKIESGVRFPSVGKLKDIISILDLQPQSFKRIT